MDLEARLRVLLKSHDRIGFGRRGVLDAEPEIRALAARLPAAEQRRLCALIVSWLDQETAESVALPLHYNLAEHVRGLAVRLCATIPIPESLPVLRRLLEAGAGATGDDAADSRKSLEAAVATLSAR